MMKNGLLYNIISRCLCFIQLDILQFMRAVIQTSISKGVCLESKFQYLSLLRENLNKLS